MAREWCIAVRPAQEASADDVRRLGDAFGNELPGSDCQRVGDEWRVYFGPEGAGRGEDKIRQMLVRCGLLSAVETPFRVGRWFERSGAYVFGAQEREILTAPVISPAEITWAVSVRPATAFDWRAVRATLAATGRLTLEETDLAIEVGALDEVDATDLVDALLPSGGRERQPKTAWPV